jgi:hypothetical protein
MFVGLKKKIDLFKFNQIYLKWTKIIQDAKSICYPKEKIICEYNFWGAQCAFTHFVQFLKDDTFFSSPREYLNFLFNNGKIKYINFIW